MKINKTYITINGLKGISKSPSMWGEVKGKNEDVPLIFFKKPKWMDTDDFNELIKTIQIYIPKDKKFKNNES
jgi:hypothetical protein